MVYIFQCPNVDEEGEISFLIINLNKKRLAMTEEICRSTNPGSSSAKITSLDLKLKNKSRIWENYLRDAVLSEIVRSNMLLFSADISPYHRLFIYMPYGKYASIDKKNPITLKVDTAIVSTEDSSDEELPSFGFTTKIYFSVRCEKTINGSMFLKIGSGKDAMEISCYPGKARVSSNINGIPFQRIFQSC